MKIKILALLLCINAEAFADVYWTEVSFYGGNGTAKQSTDLDFSDTKTFSSSSSMYTEITKDDVKNKLYWGGVGKIMRSDTDGSNVEIFDSSFTDLAEGIAVDSESGHVYWTSVDGKIRRKSANGSTTEILYDSGQSLHGLAIDRTFSRLFWAGQDAGIYSSDLNCNNVNFILDAGIEVLGVAYNSIENSIYWADFQSKQIKRCNSDGTELEVVYTSLAGNPIELNFSEDELNLFWTEWTTKTLEQMNLSNGVVQTVRSFTYSPWGVLIHTPPPPPEFLYYINSPDTNTITITGYAGSSNAIVIPAIFEEKTITAIGKNAFRESNLVSIIIPDTVESIGDYAFYRSGICTNIIIPNSVKSIGANVFRECTSLVNITIPHSIKKIPYAAFENCSNLTNVTLPDSITIIDNFAFDRCSNLKAIAIPNSVTTIGYYAFQLCSNLKQIIIPNSVTVIGTGAFGYCSGAIDITIPNSIVNIDSYMFQHCSQLTEIIIPDGVTHIGEYAFKNCTHLRSITIPERVINIGNAAFYGCSYLEGIYFKGDAPVYELDIFGGYNQANVYYLPGTLGWSSIYSGHTATLWNPEILTGNANFGIQPYGFGFNVSGTNNMWVVVEACTNLESDVWIIAGKFSVNGESSFYDPFWINYHRRFYRLTMP